MKQIDQLQYKLPACRSHDKSHQWICEHDAVKSVKSFVSCEFEVHQRSNAVHTFWSQKIEESIVHSLWGTLQNISHLSLLSLRQIKQCIFANPIWHDDCLGDIHYLCQHVRQGSLNSGKGTAFAAIWMQIRYIGYSCAHIIMADRSQHICQSQLAIQTVITILTWGVRISDTSSMIEGKAAPFAGIWSKFRCTEKSSDQVLSHVMKDPALHICQLHMARRQSRQLWVLVSEYETWLAYSWHCRSICWYIL